MAGKLSRDQKRKKKLAAKQKAVLPEVTSYQGNTYRKPLWVSDTHAAETAILEAHHLSGRRLTDRQVENSLRYLVRCLRGENPSVPTHFPRDVGASGLEDTVSAMILEHWDKLPTGRPRADDAIGIIRTILASVELHRREQGYLIFLEGFLGKLASKRGYSVKEIVRLAEQGGLLD